MVFRTRMILAASMGYIIAVITSPFVPELVSLVIPVAGAAIGSLIPSKKKEGSDKHTSAFNPPMDATPIPAKEFQTPSNQERMTEPSVQGGHTSRNSGRSTEINAEFAPVIEYLNVLEDMLISEGRKNTLDNEIVEKSLALFSRLHRVVPTLQELNNGDVNHTVRRLILKDLNGFINPFLRLSGEAKTKNRRVLLNGLKEVDSKISDIVSTIEQKDLIELQTKAELIHQRYSNSRILAKQT